MKLKYLSFLVLAIGVSVLTLAHEYWIAPSKYFLQSSESFSFNCYVGEDFNPEVWAKRKDRTLQVTRFHLTSKKDITPIFIAKDSLQIPMSIKEPGNYLFALASKPSYIEMKATAFNEYLKEDGMNNILENRIANKLDTKGSREFYQRCAKSLIQVAGVNDETYKLNTGMVLEIIPQTNPYTSQGELEVYFEFKGKPLVNYQVRTWCKSNGKLIVKSFHRTNEKGKAILPIKESGEWMISLVKMELYKVSDKADYESFWGSYTFYKK
jgi:uncharacterized GH25 family protein